MRKPKGFSMPGGVRVTPAIEYGRTDEGIVWEMYWNEGDTRVHRRLGRQKNAVTARAAALAKLGDARPTGKSKPPPKDASKWLVSDILDIGEQDFLTDRSLSDSTKRAYSYALRHLRDGLGSEIVPRVTRATIDAYLDDRTASGAAGSTLQVELALLTRCWRVGQQGLERTFDLPRAKVINRKRRHIVVPSPDEIRKVLAWVKENEKREWVYVALVLAWGTGARGDEVGHIRWRDIDVSKGVLRLSGRNGGKTGERTIQVQVDSPWWRVLHTWKLKRANKGAIDPDEYLLGVTPASMRVRLTDEVIPLACEACGVPRFTLHAIRHTAVTAFCNSGPINAAELRARFGHSIKTANERYIHPRSEDSAARAARSGVGDL